MTGSIILLVILAVVALIVIGMYNKLVSLRNRFKNAFAQIDVQLKRRYDLIPNLVETAKSYLKHERETLEAVVSARNLAADASKGAAQNPGDVTAMKSLMGAEAVLGGAMGRLMAVVENYPDLKANQNFLLLQEELVGIENKIAYARQRYNRTVLDLNNAVQQFPTNIMAQFFKFQTREYFEVESDKIRESPNVKVFDGEN